MNLFCMNNLYLQMKKCLQPTLKIKRFSEKIIIILCVCVCVCVERESKGVKMLPIHEIRRGGH